MTKVINVMGQGSNVGKTDLMEGLIQELKTRGLSVATVKHDVHGFDIDHKGKDTYRHREAGAETVIISSKKRFAMIKEVEEEITFETTIKEDVDMYIEKGMSTKDAIKEVAKQRNLNKNSVYQEYHSK